MGKYVCDFETTTDVDDCRVWAYACCNVENPEDIVYGNSIDGFMEWVRHIPDSTLWFHNLKFDGEFIYNWLFDHGWEWVEDTKHSARKTFSTLISDQGNHYCCKLRFSPSHSVEIRDSLKVIPLPVAKIPKAFGLPDAKLELDYEGFREKGHELTRHEIDYITEDVVIVAKALKIMFDEGDVKMTAGSNALAAYKRSIGGNKKFRKMFPVPDYDEEVRRSYKGGFTYNNPRFTGFDVGEGISFDVNSLYPSVMRYELLPYGDPKRFEGKYEHDRLYPLYIQAVKIDATLKPDHIPCIQVKETAYSDRFAPTEYIEDTKGEIVRYVTNVDLELIFEQYDVHSIEYYEGWKFKGSRHLFDGFIDECNERKVEASKTGNDGMRMIAKLRMNSSYGKFGTSPKCRSMKPVKRDGRIWYERLDEEEREPIYIPAASFITAYARAKTIRSAQSVFERFVYADTDSLYLVGTEVPEQLEVDPVKLGCWKLEHRFQRFKVLRPKTYVFVEDGELTVHCAGLPERCHDYEPKDGEEVPEDCFTSVTFDNFEIGAKYWGKLFNQHVDGGIVLYTKFFTIR